MEKRLNELTQKIIHILNERLESTNSNSSRPVRCMMNSMVPASYTLNILRIHPEEILVQELVSAKERGNIVYRSWTFRKEEQWYLAGMEKLGKAIMYRSIGPDLTDLLRRCDTISAIEAGEGLYLADASEKSAKVLSVEIPSDYELKRNGIFPKTVRFLSKHSSLVAASILFLGIASILGLYVINLGSMQDAVDQSVQAYRSDIDTQVENFLSSTEDEILSLIQDVEKNKKDFEFDRHNAYLNVQRLAEELTRYTPSRKKAYRLIASNILQSTTYSEIMYEMSRLPTEEYQARIFLATNRQSVIPLAKFQAGLPDLSYPVQVNGENNDGKGFRITDGYMVRRENPLGTGGSSPHFAVDIINVSNIAYVNHAGEIIREGNPPGNVVAVADGTVKAITWDDGYGWNIEIEHKNSNDLMDHFPEAESWTSYYAHLKEKPDFEIGTEIKQKQVIGQIGNTGRSTGPHLHFELRVYNESGRYRSGDKRFDKVNPFPEEKKVGHR